MLCLSRAATAKTRWHWPHRSLHEQLRGATCHDLRELKT